MKNQQNKMLTFTAVFEKLWYFKEKIKGVSGRSVIFTPQIAPFRCSEEASDLIELKWG